MPGSETGKNYPFPGKKYGKITFSLPVSRGKRDSRWSLLAYVKKSCISSILCICMVQYSLHTTMQVENIGIVEYCAASTKKIISFHLIHNTSTHIHYVFNKFLQQF